MASKLCTETCKYRLTHVVNQGVLLLNFVKFHDPNLTPIRMSQIYSADTPDQSDVYRVRDLLGKNLLLTWFQMFRRLVGRYCSCLLPRQDGGTSQIQVNRRFY